jgi:hypothetical protein
MNDYPCKECIVKGICREVCDKVAHHIKDLYKRIRDEGCCPDCGHTICIIYDGEYVYDGTYLTVVECTECYSSFYPTMFNGKLTAIFGFEKNWNTESRRDLKPTTFREYINKWQH